MSAISVSRRSRVRATARPAPGAVVTWLAIAVLVVIACAALLAPWIAPHDPNAQDLLTTNAPVSLGHPFGTDSLGRDIFSRVIWGARISLIGPLLVTCGAIVVGTIVAVSSAWIGGRFDLGVGLVTDICMAFPALLLAVLVAAFVGPGLWAPVFAVTIANIPYTTRLIRSAALPERSLPYVDALYLQGQGSWRICARHIAPNIAGFIAAQATLTFGYSMVDLAAVSFLGFGVQPPTAEWGSMVAEGQAGILDGRPQEALAAGLLIVITVIAVTLLGDVLTDRMKGRAHR